MFLLSFGRSILFAFQSFWRNIWLSLATVFIICLALLSINFLIVINAISDSAIVAVQNRIDVSVYFKPAVREAKIAEVKSQWEALPQVKNIAYKSPEENLEDFKMRHQNDTSIQETLKELEGNPLGATLVIKAKNLESYPEVLKAIDNPAYADLIEEKNYDDHQIIIDRLNAITDNFKKGALIVSLMFAIISILIVFNTVRIAIFTHQSEISIMKLVGANNWLVRAPFIWESIIAGIIACLVVLAVIYPLLSFIQPYLARFLQGVDFNLVSYFNHNIIWIFGSQLIGIIIINFFSSMLAVGKYLKV